MYFYNGMNIYRSWADKLRTLNEAVKCKVHDRTCFIYSQPTPPCTSRQDQLQPRSYGQPGQSGCFKGSGNSAQASIEACLIPNVYSTSSNHWDTSLLFTPLLSLGFDLRCLVGSLLAHACVFSWNVRFYLGLYIGPFSSFPNSPTRI